VSGDLSVKTVDFSGRPFHFIGVGGIGMSALAYILAQRQLPVSGSDVRPNHITKRLQAVGTYIFDRQEAANLEFFNLPDRNPEPALSILAGKQIATTSINL
jgi:UDP-N-acetylmuramate--alanine ligase